MKRHIIFLFLILLISLIIPFQAQAQSGDISFWLPAQVGIDAQVKRNEEYFSIKLESVFAYYKSGFFENIKNLIVASEFILAESKSTIQSTVVNKTWQKLDKDGDFIGANDHLVVLAPSTASNVQIKVSFRGIAEDKFLILFQALSDPTFKSALSFSPATSATVSAIAPIIQKLLSSPYTSSNPRQILDVSQSYVIYAETDKPKEDSLREGYLVILSSREGKSDDLKKILTLLSSDPSSVRIHSTTKCLEYKEGTEWKQLKSNSYVVLSITKASCRGVDEGSKWFSKYKDAIEFAKENKGKEAVAKWKEGNALLNEDPNYIQSERNKITYKVQNDFENIIIEAQAKLEAKSEALKSSKAEIEAKSKTLYTSKAMSDTEAFMAAQAIFEAETKAFMASQARLEAETKAIKALQVALDAKVLGVPSNFKKLARKYEDAVAKQSAQITVRAEGVGGMPLPQKQFRLIRLDTFMAGAIVQTTNEKGELVIKGLSPGKYSIESAGEIGVGTGVFIVDPKDKKIFEFKEEKKLFYPVER